MMVGIARDLHVVADDAGAAAARRHRTAVWIGQRDLLIGRRKHLLLVDSKLTHFLLQLCQLLGEPRYLRGQRLRRLLSVGRVKLAQIASDALLQLGTPPFHLRPVKFLSRLFTALNLLPSIATLAVASKPISRQSSTKRTHTLRSARPLSLRKS